MTCDWCGAPMELIGRNPYLANVDELIYHCTECHHERPKYVELGGEG